MFAITELVKAQGGEVDPYQTKLFPQVIHLQLPQYPDKQPTVVGSKSNPPDLGDVFVFPSGTIVTWSLSNKAAMQFIEDVLVPSAENPHLKEMETESLDYLEDQTRENSSIRGDTITIGSKIQPWPRHEAGSCNDNSSQKSDFQRRERADITFTKIAFSSGLARSTKLAVLETLLDDYFESTRSIPTLMSQGSRLPFTRSFILRKTGQLLNLRAQLNLYSELTDSLPDLFWDSRHDLGLEAYYDQVGWALDVGIRIKVLNSKMDYAQEIASVLRERLSEKHGLVLEWMIIALIAVEVGFEILRLWKEKKENSGVSTARSNG
ncbi:MAG: hypothetical protein M1829_002348 [Trizodia sp. TS-e1964]|nr:MAG: hypothetical protein M1829_002348 [Trizodia sp. TS-e1964]